MSGHKDKKKERGEDGKVLKPDKRRSQPVPKATHGPEGPRARVRSGVHMSPEDTDDDDRSGERPASLESPTPDRVLQMIIDLSRAVSPEMTPEEIAIGYVDALQTIFPARRFALRLLDANTGDLVLVHATDPLRGDHNGIEVSQEAVERHSIPDDMLTTPGVRVVSHYSPLFEPGAVGFDVPMVDRKRVAGVLGVEYPLGIEEPAGDRGVVVQMALHVGSALRNSRLLRESRYLRDYLEKVLDHANAPIIVIGRHREIRSVNQAFLSLTGLERSEILGDDFVRLLAEQDRAVLVPVFINAFHGEPTITKELHFPRRSGGFARIALNTASIRNSDGEVEAVIAIGQDLTEVRQLEEQIVQAEKLATLGQLAAGVVHELNNPLTSISVYSDYLLKKAERLGGDDPDVEKLRRIVGAAERILRFTRDLVTYARPSAEEPRLLSIHEVLDQSAVFCEHLVADTGMQIEKSYAEELPLVYGVKSQLHQVFINIITNACHAMTVGEGRLHIATELTEADYLTIRLEDNGAGIPSEEVDQVFEPFFSTKTEGKGTGLGLSIVRNILRQHNGDISVESEVGRGTAFEITLPCPEVTRR